MSTSKKQSKNERVKTKKTKDKKKKKEKTSSETFSASRKQGKRIREEISEEIVRPSNDAEKEQMWQKPKGWSQMSKSKKRRLRKMMVSKKISAENGAGREEAAGEDRTIAQTRPKGWDNMSKSKKRRIRKLELAKRKVSSSLNDGAFAEHEKEEEEEEEEIYAPFAVEKEETASAERRSDAKTSKEIKEKKPKLVAVKDHPMYRPFWRLSLHPGVCEEDVKAKMSEAHLDENLYGLWSQKISLRGHGRPRGRTSKSKLRRERKRRMLERHRKEASLEDRAHWDQVGVTQKHSFVKSAKKGYGNETNQTKDSQEEKKKKKKKKKKHAIFKVREDRTVSVTGLPHHVGVRKVRNYFKSCGAVAFVSMPTFEDTGKSCGIAQVSFTRKSSAQRALELSGEYWGQRYLDIKPYDMDQWKPTTVRQENSHTVFVGNLSYEVDEEALRDIFSPCGSIESVRWGTDKESGEFRCFGHVSFTESSSVERAVALAGSIFLGRPLRVDYAEEKGES